MVSQQYCHAGLDPASRKLPGENREAVYLILDTGLRRYDIIINELNTIVFKK